MNRRIQVMKKFMLAIALTLAISAPAFAQQIINFDAPLVDLDKKPFLVPGAEGKSETLTLGMAAIIALNNEERPNSPVSAAKKYQDGLLAHKIYKSKAALTVEELSSIKEAIGKQFPPLVIVAAYRMLDPALAENKKEGNQP
jgi:hypothetical protein